MNTEQAFWDCVEPEPNSGCWLWGNSWNADGYGQVRWQGRMLTAHRVGYVLAKGDPGALDLDHLCRVKACVNPAHLEPVTARVNTIRGVRFGRNEHNGQKTHCPRGHLYDISRHGVTQCGGPMLARWCSRCIRAAARIKDMKKLGVILTLEECLAMPDRFTKYGMRKYLAARFDKDPAK
jgi:hypothetical protein